MYDDERGPDDSPVTTKAIATRALALLAGLGAGGLAFTVHHSEPEAFLAALAAAAQALTVAGHLAADDDRPPRRRP